jgi:hypothetical protein
MGLLSSGSLAGSCMHMLGGAVVSSVVKEDAGNWGRYGKLGKLGSYGQIGVRYRLEYRHERAGVSASRSAYLMWLLTEFGLKGPMDAGFRQMST